MNIDLLITGKGEPGLICDEPFPEPVVAVMFDPRDRQLSVELEDHQAAILNITVADELAEDLRYADMIEIGTVMENAVTESIQVPLIVLEEDSLPPLDDLPFRRNSVLHFESFAKNVVSGQPVHRSDLGNEAALKTVMDATQMVAPQYSPALAHQRRLEAAPRAPAPHNAPSFGPGAGGGGGGRRVPGHTYRKTPAANRDDNGERD
ncbi:MAG: hypothetical protein EOM26_02155 [Alphaproteobacteria bacterium]|nr:hypothetical protein [Alphaproteobacteria bacterium]